MKPRTQSLNQGTIFTNKKISQLLGRIKAFFVNIAQNNSIYKKSFSIISQTCFLKLHNETGRGI